MKKRFHWMLVLPALCGLAITAFGDDGITSTSKRQASLELAAKLLAPQANPVDSLPAEIVDPFNPVGFGGAPSSAASLKPGDIPRPVVSSDRETLEKIAKSITPSGVVMFGGSPLLLFREKRLRVGDVVRITFEGTEYAVTIRAIDQTFYKLALNREEIVRPIKTGNAP